MQYRAQHFLLSPVEPKLFYSFATFKTGRRVYFCLRSLLNPVCSAQKGFQKPGVGWPEDQEEDALLLLAAKAQGGG